MIYLFAFILAITILVAVHEWAHFYTAKKLGIKVLEFSVGMGPCIAKHTGKDGIDYKICALPIGGYVNMLDERQLPESHNYTKKDLEKAFNRQPLWKRALVVANGPISNLVLAFFLFFFIGTQGTTSFKPVIGDVQQESWAKSQGFSPNDHVLTVNDAKVDNWSHFLMALVKEAGNDNVSISLLRNGSKEDIKIDMEGFSLSSSSDPFGSNGFLPFHKTVEPIIKSVQPGSPAEKAGLKPGDRINSINERTIKHWKNIHFSNDSSYTVTLEREGSKLITTIVPILNKGRYVIGIAPVIEKMPEEFLSVSDPSVPDAISYGIKETWVTASTTLATIPKLVTRDISLDALTGPIGIGKVTGKALEQGYMPFVYVLAILSVSLFVINILPIPCLDGGHLFFFMVEAVRKKPLSVEVEKSISTAGAIALYALFAIVIINDIGAL